MIINVIKRTFSENKSVIILSIIIFLISIILGYVLKPYLYSYLNPAVNDLSQKVHSGVVKLTFADIFSNNIRVVFRMFIFGLAFCFSAVILAYNGFFTGYYISTRDNLFYTLLLIVPHGIFEFSSCILACSSGLVLFNFLYKFLKSVWNQDSENVLEILRVSFNESSDKLKQALILLVMASILMTIACFVEVYLTIPIANWIVSVVG